MNGKMHSETGAAFTSDGMRAEILNPFVHKLELDNTYDKIKVQENLFTYVKNHWKPFKSACKIKATR